MSEQYYREALKLGQREYRACQARGEDPHLPVLDELVTQEQYTRGEPLGTIHVPAEFIIGTKSAGRTAAFARNYMPLLAEGSEFGLKWLHLCAALLQ